MSEGSMTRIVYPKPRPAPAAPEPDPEVEAFFARVIRPSSEREDQQPEPPPVRRGSIVIHTRKQRKRRI
jgi:hypothetical protein